MQYNEILETISKNLLKLQRTIQPTQRSIYSDILERLQSLETVNGRIKPTVRNLSVIASIKNRLSRLVLNDDYLKDVKEFARSFNEITTLQNQYYKQLESTFKPRPLLRAIRKQAIGDTVKALAGAGIGESIGTQIADILNSNITTGGSYAALTEQLRESLLNTETPGVLEKHISQIATDSINQYNAQYTQVVSSDLGFEWYTYQNTEIKTSRGFCQAMVEGHRLFHVSSIPNLLKGMDEGGNKLRYKDNYSGQEKTVELYSKTGLPNGFIPGTDVSNFLIRRGGYNCDHQARPVSDRLAKTQYLELYAMITSGAPYQRWKKANQK